MSATEKEPPGKVLAEQIVTKNVKAQPEREATFKDYLVSEGVSPRLFNKPQKGALLPYL